MISLHQEEVMRVTNLNASRPIVDVSTAWLAYWEKMRGQNAYGEHGYYAYFHVGA